MTDCLLVWFLFIFKSGAPIVGQACPSLGIGEQSPTCVELALESWTPIHYENNTMRSLLITARAEEKEMK